MIETVEIDNKGLVLRGILHRPLSKEKIPVVIMYHGFTGYKHEIHFMFAKTSKLLEKKGIASVRFDFSGSGESDGEFKDMTFSSELSDALKIFEYVKKLDFVDKSKIYILGMSMGGAIASVVASKKCEQVKKLCLWAPAGRLDFTLRHYVQLLKGEMVFDTRGCIDLNANVVSKALFDELEDIDIYDLSKDYKEGLLILHGSEDEVVSLDSSYKYLELYGDKAKLHIVNKANHTFDSESWETEAVLETVNFFND